MTPYEHLVAKAEEIGWPAYYKNDLLVHDKQSLEGMPHDVPFLWFVRETGTWIVTPNGYGHPKFEGRLLIPNEYSLQHRGFAWTGSQLVELPFEEWQAAYVKYITRLSGDHKYDVTVTHKFRRAPWSSRETSQTKMTIAWCKDLASLRSYVMEREKPKGMDNETVVEIVSKLQPV